MAIILGSHGHPFKELYRVFLSYPKKQEDVYLPIVTGSSTLTVLYGRVVSPLHAGREAVSRKWDGLEGLSGCTLGKSGLSSEIQQPSLPSSGQHIN